MYAYRLRIAALAAVAAAGLAACTTPFGYGGVSVGNGYYGSNYGYGADYGYGYGGGYPSYGYGAGYPGYGYGYNAGYPGYGLGYAPYWGWYDNFYYPGTGYYVYDAYRKPHRWTDAQRRYWRERLERARASSGSSQPVVIRENWNDFPRNRPATRPTRVNRKDDQTVRIDRVSRPIQVERNVPAERVERTNGSERAERSVIRSETRSNNALAREQRRTEARSARTSEERSEDSKGRRVRGSSDD
jgi:hypothetical protein